MFKLICNAKGLRALNPRPCSLSPEPCRIGRMFKLIRNATGLHALNPRP